MGLLAGTRFDRPPHCERCELPETECKCPAPEPVRTPPEKQTARVAVEKRKRGKMVTVVRGLNPDNDLAGLLTRLKTICGAGGTLSDTDLEVQGEHTERIGQELTSLGYRVNGGRSK